MATGILLPNGKQAFTDANSRPLAGGQVYFYQANTLTPKDTFQDSAMTVLNTNPVILDARGEATIFGTGAYRQILKDASSVLIWDKTLPDMLASVSDALAVFTAHNVYTADTFADVRLVDATVIKTVLARGATALGDGGTGTYRFDPTDTTSADDNATILVGPSGARWKRMSFGRQTNATSYIGAGGIAERFGSRVFIGGASQASGANITAQGDWLTTFQLAKGRANGTIQSAQSAILTESGPDLGAALVIGAQTSVLNNNYNAVPLTCIGVSNKNTGTGFAYAAYMEAYREVACPNGAYALELDTINLSALSSIDPYFQVAGQTIGLQLAAGGEYSPTGQFPASAAINIRANGSTFQTGLIFGSGSISGDAITFAQNHTIRWFGSANVATSAIQCQGTTAAGGAIQRFGNGFINWLNSASSNAVLQLIHSSSDVNYLSLHSSISGQPTQIIANGSDATRDIQLQCANVWLGVYTGGAPAATGYISVKDSAGTLRKLLAA